MTHHTINLSQTLKFPVYITFGEKNQNPTEKVSLHSCMWGNYLLCLFFSEFLSLVHSVGIQRHNPTKGTIYVSYTIKTFFSFCVYFLPNLFAILCSFFEACYLDINRKYLKTFPFLPIPFVLMGWSHGLGVLI